MAHIQTNYMKLWKPQDLAIDKINSQRMFIDNINAMEAFALSTLKKLHTPVASITELRAIDTSDTILYTNGIAIIVRSSGLYFFDRSSTATDNNDTIIAPTTGGGRWISDRIFLNSTSVGLDNVPNVTTNDQTPTYTQASVLTNLTSGEKLSISMGKIMKAIADLVTHIANKVNPHNVTTTQIGAAIGNGNLTFDINLNTITTSGMYRFQTCQNGPPNEQIMYSQLLVIRGSGDSIAQMLFRFSDGAVFTRSGNGPDVGGTGSWTTWQRMITADMVNTLATAAIE